MPGYLGEGAVRHDLGGAHPVVVEVASVGAGAGEVQAAAGHAHQPRPRVVPPAHIPRHVRAHQQPVRVTTLHTHTEQDELKYFYHVKYFRDHLD